jgi:hypothetical protein
MPEPAGVILFIGFSSLAWLGNVCFLAGYLIKKEIGDCLKDSRDGLSAQPQLF